MRGLISLLCHLVLMIMLLTQATFAQTNTIQKLKGNIATATNVHQKMIGLSAFCEQGYSLHPDTLIFYANHLKLLAKQSGDIGAEARSVLYLSSALTTKGLIDSSYKKAQNAMTMLQKNNINDAVLAGNIYNQMGRCFMRNNRYKDAISMAQQVIVAAEKGGDILLQMKGKTLMGWAYLEMDQGKKALEWHLNALRTATDSSYLKKYGILFANIALNYNGLGQVDSAFYYIERAVRYSREDENLFALSNSLAIQAQLFVLSGQPHKAEAPLQEVVVIRRQIGDPFYIVSDMSQLGLYYARNGQYNKGIEICKEGLAIARAFAIDSKLPFLYSSLGENYKAAGDHKQYAITLEKLLELKDSVYEKNSAQAIAEMQARYELQKKENIIMQHKLTIINRNYLLYSAGAVTLLGILIIIILFKQYKRKQKQRVQKLVGVEKEMASLAIKRAEENERKRIAADLHDNMGAYASAISANVDEMLQLNKPNPELLHNMRTNAGEIMVNLRDTIWVLNRNEITMTGVSDRLKSFIQKIGRSYPTISVEIEERITNDISLSPEKALNMMRILQEAFHNAIRHSQCTHITIEVVSEQRWYIRLVDDGIGVDASAGKGGDGINNMLQRAALYHWRLTVKRMIPEGTMVELSAI